MKLTTYSDFASEYETICKEISEKENECAGKGMDFLSMVEETKELRKKAFVLSKEMRIRQEPNIKTGRKWKGQFFEFDAFIEFVKAENVNDNDGYGYYATNGGVSDIFIYPSDIEFGLYRKDFSRVLWFNK